MVAGRRAGPEGADQDGAAVGGLLAAVAYLAIGAGAGAGVAMPGPDAAWWAPARVALGLAAGSIAAGIALIAVAALWAGCRRLLMGEGDR